MTKRDLPRDGETWDERSLLLTMLRYTQEIAVAKVSGLSEELARATPLPTSPRMALSNVLNHLRWVEWSWIHVDILGEPDEGPWTKENPDAEFDQGSELPLEDVIELTRSRPRRPARSSAASTSMPSPLDGASGR